jgi:hypothetical protein
MKIVITFISFIFLLPGCAILGSESYFAADTTDGIPEWSDDPDIFHITGKPDSIRYIKDEIEFKVYSPHLASEIYSFGPCIPIPLPVIPLFGLDHSEQNGPVQIRFYVFQSSKTYQLIKATVLADNKSLSPMKIYAYHHNIAEGKYIADEAFLPLSLIDESTYVLTYDILRSSTAVYDLVFFMQNETGSKFFKDKISFKQDTSTTFVCVP